MVRRQRGRYNRLAIEATSGKEPTIFLLHKLQELRREIVPKAPQGLCEFVPVDRS